MTKDEMVETVKVADRTEEYYEEVMNGMQKMITVYGKYETVHIFKYNKISAENISLEMKLQQDGYYVRIDNIQPTAKGGFSARLVVSCVPFPMKKRWGWLPWNW